MSIPRAPASPFGAFDADHPPDAALIRDCVHCGFCLPACPTYQLLDEEMDSPRGRIYLMAGALAGERLSEEVTVHFDRCLGCLACVSACPSGVRYDALIEATRPQVERHHRRSPSERLTRALIFSLFPYRKRLRALRLALGLYQGLGLDRLLRKSGLAGRLPGALRAMEELAPRHVRTSRQSSGAVPGPRRGRVGLVTGCVQGALFPQVNAATERVLDAEGFAVHAPTAQGCCGALSAHAGRRDEAVAFARELVGQFSGQDLDAIIVNSAGCGSTLKGYGHLLADEPDVAEAAAQFAARVRDVSEFLAEHERVAPRHALAITLAYHDACHLAHGQGVRAAPRALLGEIPGLELTEVADGETCCGSAGIYNLVQPEIARRLGDAKAAAVADTGAALVVAGNPGCTMQIAAAARRRGFAVAVAHTIEVIDASIAGEDAPGLVARLGRIS